MACRERKQTEKAKAGRTRPCFLPGAERLHGGRGRAPEAGLSQRPSIRAAALTVRAAASICARNAPALFVPCHRVLRTDGTLGRFAWGLDVKRSLLDREAALS